MTSVGYQGQDGIIKHASKDQYNVRVNVDANPTSASTAATRKYVI
jgi:hypothetical protein